jgi:hypothetical protein
MIQRYPADSAVAAALLLEVEMRDEVNQERAERRKESENSEPNKYESAFVLSLRGRGHPKDEMQSPKKLCQISDHHAPCEFREALTAIGDPSPRCPPSILLASKTAQSSMGQIPITVV